MLFSTHMCFRIYFALVINILSLVQLKRYEWSYFFNKQNLEFFWLKKDLEYGGWRGRLKDTIFFLNSKNFYL
jgi:hypothetical protein